MSAASKAMLQKLEVSSRVIWSKRTSPLIPFNSPDLLTTQRSFWICCDARMKPKSALRSALQSAQNLIESAKRRLAQWNITPTRLPDWNRAAERRKHSRCIRHSRSCAGLLVDQGRRFPWRSSGLMSSIFPWSGLAQFYQDELRSSKRHAVTVTTDSYPDEKFTVKSPSLSLPERRQPHRARADGD